MNSDFTAIRDLLTTGGGVPKKNLIYVGTTPYYCLLTNDVWSTETTAADRISAATANAIKNWDVEVDNVLVNPDTGYRYVVVRWQDPGAVWWCTLTDAP